MKRLLLTVIILILPAIAFAQLKVGIMNPDEVLDALPETAQVEADIQSFIQEQQSNYQNRYQTWIDDLTQFSEQVEAGQLSQQEQQQQEAQLVETQEVLSNLQERIQRQIQERQNELFSPLLNRVEEAMAQVSENLGLDFVINKTASSGDPIVYYSSQRGVDITERVIQYLTQN